MNSPIMTAQRLDWRGWWFGIWSAAVSGGAGSASAALSTMIVDPDHFNIHAGLGRLEEIMVAAFVIPAFVSLMKFLATHPIPDPAPQQVAANVEITQKIIPTDPTQPATITKTTTPVIGPETPK